MTNFNFQQTLHKNQLLMFFFILYSLFFGEYVFSINHWNRDYISITYDKSDSSICVVCQFFDFEFGPFAEHAYLEFADFKFTTDDKEYKNLMRWEVKDLGRTTYSVVRINNIFSNTKIYLWKARLKKVTFLWWEDTDTEIKVLYANDVIRPFLPIKCVVPSDVKIKNIIVTLKWHVNGLYCGDNIAGSVYPIEGNTKFESVVKTFAMNKSIDRAENYTVKVASVADGVVIKGAKPGENIHVYANSGTLVKSKVVGENVENIKLPTNQVYIVQVGQVHYKVACKDHYK